MLIKHYIELRGRFASFSVDGTSDSTLDGLVFVRVQDIQPQMRARLARLAAHATSQNLG